MVPLFLKVGYVSCMDGTSSSYLSCKTYVICLKKLLSESFSASRWFFPEASTLNEHVRIGYKGAAWESGSVPRTQSVGIFFFSPSVSYMGYGDGEWELPTSSKLMNIYHHLSSLFHARNSEGTGIWRMSWPQHSCFVSSLFLFLDWHFTCWLIRIRRAGEGTQGMKSWKLW